MTTHTKKPTATARCAYCSQSRQTAAGWIGHRDLKCSLCERVTDHEIMQPLLLDPACAYLESLIVQLGVDLSYGNQTEDRLAWLEVAVDADGGQVRRRASINNIDDNFWRLRALRAIWRGLAAVHDDQPGLLEWQWAYKPAFDPGRFHQTFGWRIPTAMQADIRRQARSAMSARLDEHTHKASGE